MSVNVNEGLALLCRGHARQLEACLARGDDPAALVEVWRGMADALAEAGSVPVDLAHLAHPALGRDAGGVTNAVTGPVTGVVIQGGNLGTVDLRDERR